MPCKYYDCGWCYAPEDVSANEMDGQCWDMDRCPQSRSWMQIIYEPQIKSLQFRDDGDDSEEHY